MKKGKKEKICCVTKLGQCGPAEESMVNDQARSRRRAIIVGAAAVAAGLLLIAVVISNINTVPQHGMIFPLVSACAIVCALC